MGGEWGGGNRTSTSLLATLLASTPPSREYKLLFYSDGKMYQRATLAIGQDPGPQKCAFFQSLRFLLAQEEGPSLSWTVLFLNQVALVLRNPPANRRDEFNPWVRKIPWRRKWQPTPIFLPGKSHGQRSPVATVHGVTELDTTERLSTRESAD